jgi:hypothetical protein
VSKKKKKKTKKHNIMSDQKAAAAAGFNKLFARPAVQYTAVKSKTNLPFTATQTPTTAEQSKLEEDAAVQSRPTSAATLTSIVAIAQPEVEYSNVTIGADHKRKAAKKGLTVESDTDSDVDFHEDVEKDEFGELSELDMAMKEDLIAKIIHDDQQHTSNHALTAEQQLNRETKIANLKHSEIQEQQKGYVEAFRAANAVDFEELAKDPQALLMSALKDSSQNQYISNKNRVIKAGFPWTTKGLYGYFTSAKIACNVANSSCYSTLSTFKFLYSIENYGAKLPENDEHLLRLVLRARKNRCPDIPRIVGAITKERLEELHKLYKIKRNANLLTELEYNELLDLSTILYACALRIFQGRSLTATSITFDPKNPQIAWVDVPAKCTNTSRIMESKTVHPEFITKVKEIIERRKHNALLFPLWAKSETGASDADRLHYENLLKKVNQEAADFYCWPAATSFHGTHNFRHGAAQDAFAEGGVHLVMLRTGHLSQACALHYARSDLERKHQSLFAKLSPSSKVSEINTFLEQARAKVKKARETCDITPILNAVKNTPSNPLPNLSNRTDNEVRLLLDQRAKNQVIVEQYVTRRRQRSPPKALPRGVSFNPPPSEFSRWPAEDTKIVVLQLDNGDPIPTVLPKDFPVCKDELLQYVKKRLDGWIKQQEAICGPQAPYFGLLDSRNYQQRK